MNDKPVKIPKHTFGGARLMTDKEREMMQALAEAFKKDKEADPAPTPPHGKDER